MKKSIFVSAMTLTLALATPVSSYAQDAPAASEPAAEEESLWSFSAGADLVSAYLWRGAFNAGASFQPSLGVACGLVSLGVWGSTDFSGENKEVDIALAFDKGGFNATLTDYFYPGAAPFFTWDKEETCHQIELSLAYNFGENTNVPISILWATMLGGDDLKEDGDRQFSSYFELGYTFPVKDIEVEIAAGFTPFDSFYQDGTDGFNMVNLSVKGSYEIKFNDKFSLPVFAQFVLNPNTEDAHMAFGFSF